MYEEWSDEQTMVSPRPPLLFPNDPKGIAATIEARADARFLARSFPGRVEVCLLGGVRLFVKPDGKLTLDE